MRQRLRVCEELAELAGALARARIEQTGASSSAARSSPRLGIGELLQTRFAAARDSQAPPRAASPPAEHEEQQVEQPREDERPVVGRDEKSSVGASPPRSSRAWAVEGRAAPRATPSSVSCCAAGRFAMPTSSDGTIEARRQPYTWQSMSM